MNFSSDLFDAFKSKLHGVAQQFKGQGIIFLMGDIETSAQAFQVSQKTQNCFLVPSAKIFFNADYVLVQMNKFYDYADINNLLIRHEKAFS